MKSKNKKEQRRDKESNKKFREIFCKILNNYQLDSKPRNKRRRRIARNKNKYFYFFLQHDGHQPTSCFMDNMFQFREKIKVENSNPNYGIFVSKKSLIKLIKVSSERLGTNRFCFMILKETITNSRKNYLKNNI